MEGERRERLEEGGREERRRGEREVDVENEKDDCVVVGSGRTCLEGGRGKRGRGEYVLPDCNRFCLIAASMGPGLAHSTSSMEMNQRMQQFKQSSTAMLPSHATLGRSEEGEEEGRVKVRAALQNYM